MEIYLNATMYKNITDVTMVNGSNQSESDIEADPLFRISTLIWVYTSPILLLTGTVTNTLSICVLQRKALTKQTTTFYLTVLSFIHLFVLYFGLGTAWLKRAFDFDIRLQSDCLCQFVTFVVNVFLNMSVWTLVAVTIDRCIIVCLPHHSQTLCRLKHAKCTVAAIFASVALANIHIFWGVSLSKTSDSSQEECTHGNYFNEFVFPWISLTVGFLLPFTTMVITNSFIVRGVYASHKRLAYQYSTTSGGSWNKLSANSDRYPPHGNRSPPHRDKLSSLTTMLLARNATFLILTLPIMIFLIVEPYYVSEDQDSAALYLTWAIVNICDYSDHAINFFLYCLAGSTFRKELRNMLRPVKRHTAR